MRYPGKPFLLRLADAKLQLFFGLCCESANNRKFAPFMHSNIQSINMTDRELMQIAIRLSEDNVQNGGGPFGAVIAKDGEVVATGVNRVTANNDPTAHAEVSAIREACRKQKSFKLDGCVVYSSCEPCPMCLSALYWAGISKIYYANTKDDAKAIDFDDSFLYDELKLERSERSIPVEQLMHQEALHAFALWRDKEDKMEY